MAAIGDSSVGRASPGGQTPAGDVVDTIKSEGERLMHQAKDSADAVARQQTGAAAAFLQDVASAIHRGADELKGKGRSDAASFVEWTADEVGSLAGGLANRAPADILGEIEGLARRRPALVAGAAFLVGFGLLRFMKSTSAHAAPSHASQAHTAYTGRETWQTGTTRR